MRTLFFDCGMGAAGDMLVASLVELTDNPDQTIRELNELNIPDVTFVKEKSVKCGVTGTHIRVIVNGQEEDEHMHDHHHHHDHKHDHEHHHDHNHEHEHCHCHEHEHEHCHDHDHEHEHCHCHDHEHHHDHQHGHEHHHDHEHSHEHGHHFHSSMHGIEHIVRDHISVSDKVKDNVMSVYRLIAEAESTVHDSTIENIHFHEVGTMDAVADITAFCYLIEKLNIDKIYASPIHVGKGTVRCAHGILPVPAPATALILKGIPIYSREYINGELCTPTGAALLKQYADSFIPMPVMTMEKIGYGMGTKDFPVANCVRAILCEETKSSTDEVIELDFNVDDMTGEEIGYVTELLLKNGAREVFSTPVFMKKNRPGQLITILCSPEKKDEIVSLVFRHTTTIGIRESRKTRYVLERSFENVETPYGTVQRKVSSGYGTVRQKYEYDDISKIAEETGKSIKEIMDSLK